MIDRKTIRWVFSGVVSCIVLYWILHETDRVKAVWDFITGMLSPFAIGAGLAFILNVPLRAIESKLKFVKNGAARRALAMVLTFLAIALIVYVIVILVLPQVVATVESIIDQLPAFFDRILRAGYDFVEGNPELMDWLYSNTDLESFDWAGLIEKIMTWLGDSLSTVVTKAFYAIGSLSTGIFNGVISLVFALYCLGRKEVLARQGRKLLYAFLPERFCDDAIRVLRLTSKTFSNFISGQCLEALILGCMFAIAMLIFRMPYIPLVSVLIAVTALVPIVGAFVGCGLGAFFIFVDDPMLALWFVVMFLVIQQIEGNVIYPKVVGSSVGLPGMWVLLAVTVGGELMGVAGMLVMIPLASVVYTILREWTSLRVKARNIDPEKLMDQPLEVRNRLAETHRKAKLKRRKKVEDPEEQDT
ncbi:MAG: AI-2E family transporter [Oscillospiraceae bacterium]|nr:AI-2E family transporter [Oscillospiraceae bacterium]